MIQKTASDPYGCASRFEDERRGTNPEEILAAAQAACFTMAFSFPFPFPFAFACDKAGVATGKVDAKAQAAVAEISLQARLETAAA